MWKYGDAGDRWPVQVGDVWRAGDSILACGDLECGAAVELLTLGYAPVMMYSDPPWNAGNARSFRTKAGVGRPVDFPNLIRRVLEAAKMVQGPVFLEMGRQHAEDLAGWARGTGGVELGRWDTTYYRKHPMVLFQFTWHGPAPVRGAFQGIDDDDTPAIAIGQCSKVGDYILDVCTGRGLTCRTAVSMGRRFIGMELHPRRLAVALDWLANNSGFTPERIGRLVSMTGVADG